MYRCLEFSKIHGRHGVMIAVVVSLALLSAPAIAVAEIPIVIAIDTSRSLSPSELQSTLSKVDEILGGLPEATPVGLLAFNDSPQWIVEIPGTKTAVEKALTELRPAGNFTLLNDALFTTARALPEGGVILLLTDGRDENSATTVDDVAGLALANHVRILAIGAGRHVDNRALRRLALLSDGASLGKIEAVDPAAAIASLRTARRTTASEIEAARLASSTRKPVDSPPTAASRPLDVNPPGADSVPWWLLPLLGVLILGVLAILATLLMLRRGGSPRDRDSAETKPTEAGEWDTDPELLPEGVSNSAKAPALELPPTPPMDRNVDELTLDPSAFERLPFNGNIDATSVLDEQHILSIVEAGKEVRTFRLRQDRAFAVGRAPGVNTISLDSKSLSAQHFKLVPHEGGFAVVDLDSTNGTLVNGQKIRAHHLKAGDHIQAGELEFEFKRVLRSVF